MANPTTTPSPSGEQATQSRGLNIAGETEIRRLLDKYGEAFRAANIDELLSFYSPDVVAFDLVPPLQFTGRDAYAKAWREAGSMMKAPWIWETRDERIYAGDDLAFVHHLVNCGGTSDEGKQNSGWIRHTACLRKLNGQWQIIHDQFSVPVDMHTGKALMDQTPESAKH